MPSSARSPSIGLRPGVRRTLPPRTRRALDCATRPDGGTGRRTRFRILGPEGRASSSLAPGTHPASRAHPMSAESPEIRIETTEEGPVARRLEVAVAPARVRQAFDRAYRELARSVRVR